ncbi:cysteine-rich repeat secretory protein 38-like [Typha latifolia]|uniref:cysteine-rich repeat secretory protein 38-like n=1 Tax=Typha latifolia TaxID=4733 RepID=UPI003C2FAC15
MSLLLSLLIILQIPATKSDFIQNECSNDRYKANSAFQANLNTLFSSLNSAATSSGFATGTVGRDPDKVYGLALCHGDLSPSDCKSCIYNSIQDIEFRCPFDMSAMVWYDDCSLRYSNTSFFSILEYSSKYCTSNSANAEKPQLFKKILGLLMDNLTAEAVYGSAQMFATEVVNVTGVTKIYGLAQCTRDLSEQQCTNCLVNFVDKIRSCCTGSTGCRVFGHSCYIRYEVYPFFNLLVRKNETAPHASPSLGPVRAASPPPTSPHFSSAPPGGSRGGGSLGETKHGICNSDAQQSIFHSSSSFDTCFCYFEKHYQQSGCA